MRKLTSLLLLGASLAAAQQPSLTPDQQALFTAAKADFAQHHLDLALAKMKQLHTMVPDKIASGELNPAATRTGLTLPQKPN